MVTHMNPVSKYDKIFVEWSQNKNLRSMIEYELFVNSGMDSKLFQNIWNRESHFKISFMEPES